MLQLPEQKRKNGVIIASLGNEALGLCYYTHEHNISVIVVMPLHVPLSLKEKILKLGAKIILHGRTLNDLDTHAQSVARKNGFAYINRLDFQLIINFYSYNLYTHLLYYKTILKQKCVIFFISRDYVPILAGYGTIALEILQDIPSVEAIIVPVGTGGLAAGIATVIRHMKKNCLIYVCTGNFILINDFLSFD